MKKNYLKIIYTVIFFILSLIYYIWILNSEYKIKKCASLGYRVCVNEVTFLVNIFQPIYEFVFDKYNGLVSYEFIASMVFISISNFMIFILYIIFYKLIFRNAR